MGITRYSRYMKREESFACDKSKNNKKIAKRLMLLRCRLSCQLRVRLEWTFAKGFGPLGQNFECVAFFFFKPLCSKCIIAKVQSPRQIQSYLGHSSFLSMQVWRNIFFFSFKTILIDFFIFLFSVFALASKWPAKLDLMLPSVA